MHEAVLDYPAASFSVTKTPVKSIERPERTREVRLYFPPIEDAPAEHVPPDLTPPTPTTPTENSPAKLPIAPARH